MKKLLQILTITCLAGIAVQAQTFTWDGGAANVNMKATGNWVSSYPTDSSSGDFIFNYTNITPGYESKNNPYNNALGLTFTSLQLIGSGGSWSTGGWDIGGPNAVTLAGNITASGGTHQFNLVATLGNNITISVADQSLTMGAAIGGGYGIIKTGAGALAISKANSYSGGTTISAGSVISSVSGAFGSGDVTVANGAELTMGINSTMDNTASLVLDTGSTLNLNFTASQTLGSLTVGGTALSAGTYNATALNAMGITATGTGSLKVVPEPATIGMLLIGSIGGMAMRNAVTR